MKHQALLTIQAKLRLAIYFFVVVLLFGRDTETREILASVGQVEGNFEAAISKYIRLVFLLCYGKAVQCNLQHM